MKIEKCRTKVFKNSVKKIAENKLKKMEYAATVKYPNYYHRFYGHTKTNVEWKTKETYPYPHNGVTLDDCIASIKISHFWWEDVNSGQSSGSEWMKEVILVSDMFKYQRKEKLLEINRKIKIEERRIKKSEKQNK